MNTQTLLRAGIFAAGIYNLTWGGMVILWPQGLFELLELEPINYPFFMSGIGMMVGVYGVAYCIAATDLQRYWPLLVVGILGKTLGSIGWTYHVVLGDIPAHSLLLSVFNDLIWLPPFVAALVWVARQGRRPSLGAA